MSYGALFQTLYLPLFTQMSGKPVLCQGDEPGAWELISTFLKVADRRGLVLFSEPSYEAVTNKYLPWGTWIHCASRVGFD